MADAPPPEIEQSVVIWPCAEIEGVLLSSSDCLQVMVDRGLLKPEYQSVETLERLLSSLLAGQQENVIAEMAQKILRTRLAANWPSPKGDEPVERLRTAVKAFSLPTDKDVSQAIATASERWDNASTNLWSVVRGKYVLSKFTSRASVLKSGHALLEAVARARPKPPGLEPLQLAVDAVLTGSSWVGPARAAGRRGGPGSAEPGPRGPHRGLEPAACSR